MKALVNNSSIAYDDQGSGLPVILIHGFPLCRKMWRDQSEALLSAGYRVITPDLKGFGESETADDPCSMDLFADDVVALMDHLKIDHAVIGGMSMGGYVLLSLLERYPNRVKAAIFIVTRSESDDAAGREKRTTLASHAEDGCPEKVVRFFGDILFSDRTRLQRPELLSNVYDWMLETAPETLSACLLAMMNRKNYTTLLRRFTVPSLVLGAEMDRTIPPYHSIMMDKQLPNSELHIIPGAGHMVNMEAPDQLNSHLLDFLKRIS